MGLHIVEDETLQNLEQHERPYNALDEHQGVAGHLCAEAFGQFST